MTISPLSLKFSISFCKLSSIISGAKTPPVFSKILEESLEHETHAVNLYKKLLEEVVDASVYLEEYARGQIGQEEQHALEIKKMLKDFA